MKDLKIKVAIETSNDYSDHNIGFYTHHYSDGRIGVRYRLVKIGDDGYLEGYPSKAKFFINKELMLEYLEMHKDELDAISYDDMIYLAGMNRLKMKMAM